MILVVKSKCIIECCKFLPLLLTITTELVKIGIITVGRNCRLKRKNREEFGIPENVS